MKFFIKIASLAAVAALWSVHAQAATLTFSESTTATGTLDGKAFTNALITFSGTGDTSNITEIQPGIFVLAGLPVTLSIAGLGFTDFTDTIDLVSNQMHSGVGIGDITTGNAILFGTVNNAAYDLSTSFGPQTGAAVFNNHPSVGTSHTAAGAFYISAASDVTFQSAVTDAVPEPASWALMMVGFGFAGGVLRSRKAVSLTCA